jgi:hypothetical protein
VGLSERRGTDEIQGLWPAGGAVIQAETDLTFLPLMTTGGLRGGNRITWRVERKIKSQPSVDYRTVISEGFLRINVVSPMVRMLSLGLLDGCCFYKSLICIL